MPGMLGTKSAHPNAFNGSGMVFQDGPLQRWVESHGLGALEAQLAGLAESFDDLAFFEAAELEDLVADAATLRRLVVGLGEAGATLGDANRDAATVDAWLALNCLDRSWLAATGLGDDVELAAAVLGLVFDADELADVADGDVAAVAARAGLRCSHPRVARLRRRLRGLGCRVSDAPSPLRAAADTVLFLCRLRRLADTVLFPDLASVVAYGRLDDYGDADGADDYGVLALAMPLDVEAADGAAALARPLAA